MLSATQQEAEILVHRCLLLAQAWAPASKKTLLEAFLAQVQPLVKRLNGGDPLSQDLAKEVQQRFNELSLQLPKP